MSIPASAPPIQAILHHHDWIDESYGVQEWAMGSSAKSVNWCLILIWMSMTMSGRAAAKEKCVTKIGHTWQPLYWSPSSDKKCDVSLFASGDGF